MTVTIAPFRGGPDCSSLKLTVPSAMEINRLDQELYIVADNGFTRRRCNGTMNRYSDTWVVLFLESSSSHFTLNVLIEVATVTLRTEH
jgi:hypothetical protein